MTRTVRKMVAEVMLGVLLVGPLGGCDTDELITPATDEQRSALQAAQKHDVRFVTVIAKNHNETFLRDGGWPMSLDMGDSISNLIRVPTFEKVGHPAAAGHTREDRRKRKDVKP